MLAGACAAEGVRFRLGMTAYDPDLNDCFLLRLFPDRQGVKRSPDNFEFVGPGIVISSDIGSLRN